jgi:hypothetical protein
MVCDKIHSFWLRCTRDSLGETDWRAALTWPCMKGSQTPDGGELKSVPLEAGRVYRTFIRIGLR